MRIKKTKTLKQLYQRLDNLYKDIYSFCSICKEEDCKGYVWLMPNEAPLLMDKGIPIVEINKKIYFIDSFCREYGIINVEKVKPPCRCRGQTKCLIYKYRPLICRLYPLDLKIINKRTFIILHTDCLFVQQLVLKKSISVFLNKVNIEFQNCEDSLLKKIVNIHEKVNSISKYPKNYNHKDYIKVLEIQY